MDDATELTTTAAQACRILAAKGLVEGILGHVSARLPGTDRMLIRSRGPAERGLAATTADDIKAMDGDGRLDASPEGWHPPNEYPIHTALYQARPDVGAVVHAHPPAALLCGLAGFTPQPVIGAYNIPALHLALRGVPVYPRPVLITRPDLAAEMIAAMGDADVCVLRGHGITVAGRTVQEATIRAINLEVLCHVTVELARLGATAPVVSAADLAELPDLGGQFNTEMTWQALVAECLS